MENNESKFNKYFKSIIEFTVETVKVVVISLAIILPVRYFLIQPFYVKGASMEPTFHDSEYLIIDEISYRFKEPSRGDIVVFRYPKDSSQYFIKRIIGLPKEKVEIKDGKIIIYNEENPTGKLIDESAYLDSVATTPNNVTVLEDNEYFVFGDNRNASLDSRRFGAVNKNNLIGRVWFRGWPLERIGWFETPEYSL